MSETLSIIDNPVLARAFAMAPLGKEEFKKLIERRDQGDPNAVHEIAMRNMRLGYVFVVKVSNDTRTKRFRMYESDDLWQEVYIELVNAARYYGKTKKELEYSTLACIFIKNRLMRIHISTNKTANRIDDTMSLMHGESAGNLDDWSNTDYNYDISMADMSMIESQRDSDELYKELNDVMVEALDDVTYHIMAAKAGFGIDRMDNKAISELYQISTPTVTKKTRAGIDAIRNVVAESVQNGSPKYPLLIEYWRDVDLDGLTKALTPIFIDEGDYDQDEYECESLFDFDGYDDADE